MKEALVRLSQMLVYSDVLGAPLSGRRLAEPPREPRAFREAVFP